MWREGTKRASGEKFALRLLKKSILQSTDANISGGTVLDSLAREYQVLTKLKHNNIVNLHIVSSHLMNPNCNVLRLKLFVSSGF
jgi:serine/threonine protein kinase